MSKAVENNDRYYGVRLTWSPDLGVTPVWRPAL